MTNPNKIAPWRLYERIVAAFEAENADIELSVTPNASITGHISHKQRQIDVLIDARWEDELTRRVIVDAKLYKRALNIKDVESFEGMMKDCHAERGILVCPNGWSEGAQRRAQDAITVKLLSLEELEDEISWADFEKCLGECQQSPIKRSQKGMVLWDASCGVSLDNILTIISIGKCDVCHNFHVWCQGCGEKFAIRDEDKYECSCGWLWLSAIEEEINDPSGTTLNAVHLLLQFKENTLPLDRRRLR